MSRVAGITLSLGFIMSSSDTAFDYDDDQELESLIYDEEQEDRDVTHIDYIHDNTENEDEKPRFIFKLQKSIEV